MERCQGKTDVQKNNTASIFPWLLIYARHWIQEGSCIYAWLFAIIGKKGILRAI
ncbi:hypothetical protein CBFG_05488 [Clostridiales bacterium 1_7_47FAA]|nr:hypothetical protein CBFG_05488 [Clostridiales bacterium 1_7_47FAA]